MINGINHITFAVRDLNKSLIFYRDVLGLSLIATWGDGAYLQAGSTWIALNYDPNAPAEMPADYSHIAFNVSEANFKALAERIRSCGYISPTPITTNLKFTFLICLSVSERWHLTRRAILVSQRVSHKHCGKSYQCCGLAMRCSRCQCCTIPLSRMMPGSR